ncbi:hypothetical protein ILUMI_16343 [Ignelater luminosus]|uniref:Uncharacterized protein n=1 Tax=Ignelater luminosus TaxID=2038154 RepID=A0A8K0G8M9_IGNLU|nr:hypothetical protein ILUMI_16343 [Ignelater luminosus]
MEETDEDFPHFTWISNNNFVPQNHTFDNTNSGFHPARNLTDDNILTYFQWYFTQELPEEIAMKPNGYFEFVT